MDTDSRDWENESAEDSEFATRTYSPLATLAAELALCYEAVSMHSGSPCTACTCQLGYHLSCDDGFCENCSCEEIRWYCMECGDSRPISAFIDGLKICAFCITISPLKIPYDDFHAPRERAVTEFSFAQFTDMAWSNQGRYKEARKVLQELTE